uniref:Uncharacterized protein LOC104233314 n=1 Tax=Nicotiana sylvestris TaxID=4096 RepID=A0A1U7XEX4_NICSY|nr:PREDICTED: uncharacterized protein LOC104233314 [Nicotiana sylvestris]
MFEIFAKGEKPILKFYDLRANASLQPEERKPNLDAKRVSTQSSDNKNILTLILTTRNWTFCGDLYDFCSFCGIEIGYNDGEAQYTIVDMSPQLIVSGSFCLNCT